MVSNRGFVGVEATSVCYKFSRLIYRDINTDSGLSTF